MKKKRNPNGQVYTAFLRDLISASGVSIVELSKRINVTTASISHWFASDDIRISKLCLVVESLGYDLQMVIDKKPFKLKNREPAYFSIKQLEELSLKKLHVLKSALKDSGFTKNVLAEKIGVTKEAITYWYAADDITIRRLIACAEAMDKDLYIKFVKNKTESYFDSGTGIHCCIENMQSWNVISEEEV